MFPTPYQIESLRSTLGTDLILFAPELIVCGGIVALLLARLMPLFDRTHLGVLALVALLVAVRAVVGQVAYVESRAGVYAGPYFEGMLVSDGFAGFMRGLVLAASIIVVLLTLFTGIPDTADSADFYTLLLGATLGMLVMVSANHLLMVFIGVEMASLPSYALAGFLKGKRSGSEAALKYVVYGAGASGIMLYGITLLSGLFGSGYIPDIATAMSHRPLDSPVLAGFGLLFVGLGFKLSAAPFHFWCPDVFEGAAAEVAGFLSVASKAAAIALTLRILLTLQNAFQQSPLVWSIPGTLGVGLGVIAALTATFGNLAAFGQTNIKRLLAYSTIAHAGYMLLAVATVTEAGAASVLYYLVAYLIMNLGAFAVVALVRNATRSEELSAFRGLIQRSPLLASSMTVFLLSLLGLPPLAGFAGKFQVFATVYEHARIASFTGHDTLGGIFYTLLGIGAINTVVSAYYYLKVVRIMLLDSPVEENASTASHGNGSGGLRIGPFTAAYLVVLSTALVALGIVWNPLANAAVRAAQTFGLWR